MSNNVVEKAVQGTLILGGQTLTFSDRLSSSSADGTYRLYDKFTSIIIVLGLFSA